MRAGTRSAAIRPLDGDWDAEAPAGGGQPFRRYRCTAWVVVLGTLGAAALGIWHFVPRRPGGDRNGHILEALAREADRVVVPDATVLLRKEFEPTWDSCDGRKGTGGWQPVRVLVQLRLNAEAEAAGLSVDRQIANAGWMQTLHPSVNPWDSRWSRQLPTGQTADLMVVGMPGATSTFSLVYTAQPPGPAPSGC
jgi:hypothetical protein